LIEGSGGASCCARTFAEKKKKDKKGKKVTRGYKNTLIPYLFIKILS